jgi:phosphatidylinositol-3-phosphatase
MAFRYRTRLAAALAALAAALAAFLPLPAASAGTPRAGGFTSLCGAMDTTHPARVSHVMVIVFENRGYPGIVGNASAPYLNKTLIPACGLATNYHSYSHPSLPNYLALTSGTARGKGSHVDCTPAGCPQPQASVFSQLSAAGRGWREYAEAMRASCRPTDFRNTGYVNANGSKGEFYYVRHAPPPYYTSAPVRRACGSSDVPLGTTRSGSLLAALSPSRDGLPAFSFVSPGGCDDMHDCATGVGDAWLREWVPLIQRSAAYQSGKLVVFITVDEGTGRDKVAGEPCWNAAHARSAAFPSCHVATVVMSPHTVPGTRSGSYFSHLSLLGTAEDLLGLPRLAAARGQASLRPAFGL